MTLEELCRAYTKIPEDGFCIDLVPAAEDWAKAILAVGRKKAYREMADCLCRMYREKYGREFLFTEACMAFEIQYHADAYFAMERGGFPRHISTLAFSRSRLVEHCREINISELDMESLRQRVVFRYRSGIRDCYRGTEKDPFRRL